MDAALALENQQMEMRIVHQLGKRSLVGVAHGPAPSIRTATARGKLREQLKYARKVFGTRGAHEPDIG